MPYKRINDYGVIGDMHSAALVGLDGSIDWLCFPDFDSPSVFAAILDDTRGGYWQLHPKGEYRSSQEYLPDTNVLVTTFSTGGGQVTITDLMPLGSPPEHSDHQVLRILRGVRGMTEISCHFQPRLDYASGTTVLRQVSGGVVAEQGEGRLALATPWALEVQQDIASASFTVGEGDELVFLLQWGPDRPPDTDDWRERLDATTGRWRSIVDTVSYQGPWQKAVRRSFLALQLLVYMPTGALVAAATTSLPEWIGGGRNWDYRYSWIRDAAFVLDALGRLGHTAETKRFFEWLTTFCESCGTRLQTLYGVRYEEELTERTLDHLEGYRGSRPVRIGNAASTQIQLDIFGEAMVACATYHRVGGTIDARMWSTIESFAEAVMESWRRPDRGIWEVRGQARHFVHSKVMCWLALDRAVSLAEVLQRPVDLERWRRVRDEIRHEVLQRGWNEKLQSFVQYFGASHTDSALLMMPLVGFLPADDPRMRSTVRRIREELDENGMLRRYRTDKADDGLNEEEGVFAMCALWLAGYLTFAGELDEARRLFERVLSYGNHVGLFSEMVNTTTGEALGNFPQAFTHVSIIHTARNLSFSLSTRRPPALHGVHVVEPTPGSP